MGRKTRIALAICAVLGTGGFAIGQAEQTGPASELQAVIESQLDAFQAEDLDLAFEYAAPPIQRQFQTPEIFGQMVERGYPMVWDPSSYEFLDMQSRPGAIVQRLRLFDQAGESFIAEYKMEQFDGAWRIAGVRILREALVGA